ncbi:MAG: IS66 family transposase [Pirellulales bacterium]
MTSRSAPEIVELDSEQLDALLCRLESCQLPTEDIKTLRAALESYLYVTQLIDQKSTTIARLRKLLFGAETEKTAAVTGRHGESLSTDSENESGSPGESSGGDTKKATSKPKGHGRNGANDYPGATRVRVPHEVLVVGDPCPSCERGTLYGQPQGGIMLRFTGQPPVQVTIYELEKLRCGLCGEVFTAKLPEAAGLDKYDPTVASMIALLKYGNGLPFNRLAGLQENLGMPLPSSTQWDIVAETYPQILPAYEELIREAAQGDVLHNDDTTVKILELMGERAKAAPVAEESDRMGMFTTGVVATRDGQRIALFFSGRQHAGENLRDVLMRRATDLPPPIQMCDALSRNRPPDLQTIVANCMAHARRQFVDVNEHFPVECRHVLESLQVAYHNHQLAREQNQTAEERLRFHQQHSGPTMESLREWLKRQSERKLVEPNSGLGTAINYLRKHWEKLTLFLRVAGAPLDNNICEWALKKVILHRKNALFFKTRHGAAVGDLYLSLIHTCELNDGNPFEYLTALQRHASAVAIAPGDWMPWNYAERLTGAADAG